jgi:hypothetical protein
MKIADNSWDGLGIRYTTISTRNDLHTGWVVLHLLVGLMDGRAFFNHVGHIWE